MLGLDDKGTRHLVEKATASVLEAWSAMAPSDSYRKALTSSVIGEEGEVRLTGPSVWVERGSRPRDMRESLLASPKAKVSPLGGRYRSVPIGAGRFATASDKGQAWMHPGRDGTRCVVKLKLKLADLFGEVWARRDEP